MVLFDDFVGNCIPVIIATLGISDTWHAIEFLKGYC